MKKVYLAFAAVLTVSGFLFSGCSKSYSENEDITPKINVCNPFDFVGEAHNQGLDAIYNNLTATKASNVSEEEIMKLTDIFCDEIFSKDERFFVDNLVTKSGEFDTDYAEEEVSISEEVSNYIDEIVSVASTENYYYIKEKFLSFEEDIILNKATNFTEYETSLLLCSLAIGKYSNEYWKDYNVSTKSAVGELVGADLGGAIAGIKRHAVEIVLCTALGGVGSGLAAAGKSALGPALGASAIAGISIGMGELF